MRWARKHGEYSCATLRRSFRRKLSLNLTDVHTTALDLKVSFCLSELHFTKSSFISWSPRVSSGNATACSLFVHLLKDFLLCTFMILVFKHIPDRHFEFLQQELIMSHCTVRNIGYLQKWATTRHKKKKKKTFMLGELPEAKTHRTVRGETVPWSHDVCLTRDLAANFFCQ